MIAKVTGSGERMSTYEVDDRQIAVGSTLGSPKGAIILKANGAIERFFSSDAGETMIGGMQMRFWDDRTGVTLTGRPGHYIFHPDRQEHVYELTDEITVSETVLVLNGQPDPDRADDLIAYYHATLENTGDREVRLSSIAAAEMRGSFGADGLKVSYDPARRAFLATNSGRAQFARAFACTRQPSHWELTSDHGKCSRVQYPGPLSDRLEARGHGHIALIEHLHRIGPGKKIELTFILAGSPQGVRGLRRVLDGAPGAHQAMERTRKRYDAILGRAIVMTPDADVNRGVLWAKANMLRTQLLAPTGWCFVNDPTRSNNSVSRDTAWFAFGSDYVTPDFSRAALLAYLRNMERKGMVVEYYDIRNGKTADYNLNINDDTPLIILALWHHYNATGDRAFLQRAYRGVRRAADYILSQRDDRGLVWCTSKGTSDWGIAGWRNVIKGYRLSGATTELNSECFAALGAASKMAAVLKKTKDRDRYAREAAALKMAINEHLVDPQTGLYYLNIGVDGNKRTDVTCDLVFPVMFGVADRDRAARIVSRLSVEPFWTSAGIRTVPRDDISYGPTHGYGLLGGVWVGVTFWYAFAAARFNSAFMASALSESFRHYSQDPRRNNTVPGQFSEWLHGETLMNQGMMLSPWFPPRYLWAAVEGAAGLDLAGEEPSCNPQLAPEWRWLGVRRLRFRGAFVTWFVVRAPELTMYANFRFRNSMEYHAYDEDVTDEMLDTASEEVTAIALRRNQDDAIVLFAGNTSDRTIQSALRFKKNVHSRFSVRMYSSMRGEWIDAGSVTGAELEHGMAIQIDRRGFCVVELRKQST
jgi:hypothetical protein